MKPVYIGLGFLFVGLGAVGVALPVLPTVPFLLLASFCFARGSERYHNWLINTKLYKKHLQSFAEDRAMTIRSKLTILLPVSAIMVLLIFLVNNLPMRIVMGALIVAKYYYFIFHIRTIKEERKEVPQESL